MSYENPTLDTCKRQFSEFSHDELVEEICRVVNLIHADIELTSSLGRIDKETIANLRSDLRKARERIRELEAHEPVKPTFYVDGLPQDTLEYADVVATRLFKRYDGYRTIQIKDATGVVVRELEATKHYEDVDQTIDWITE